MRGAKSNALFLSGANWSPSCPCAAPSFVDSLEAPSRLLTRRSRHYSGLPANRELLHSWTKWFWHNWGAREGILELGPHRRTR